MTTASKCGEIGFVAHQACFDPSDPTRLTCIFLIVLVFVVAAAAFRDVSIVAPHVGTVSSAQPMLEPRSGHTATLLPDGKVLIAGGRRRNQEFLQIGGTL
ncbi:MAG TPA: kelch repeat-containing protein [Candidatus Sulfotelmatobacter sp.]|nr:kelch repeat-containing protein [Candidatus Sulfotelmatobacter sp.]